MLCSQLSSTSGAGWVFVLAGFVPEGKFDSVPEPELVIDDAKVVLDDVLCGSNGRCNFAVLESLSDEFNDTLLSFTGYPLSITLLSEHSCLRYKRVASFTRLIPLVIPKRRKRRLKCALTVRRAILSWLAISALSHP